jgi:hypothetical protein
MVEDSPFARFLRRLARLIVGICVLWLAFVALQATIHPFDGVISWAKGLVAATDTKLSAQAFKGITLGGLGLILCLCIFPIFLSKIDEKAYGRGLWRGIIAAVVFYLSNELYTMAAKESRVHFIAALFGIVVVTSIVVEALSLAVKEEEQRSFRTDVVSSITSGLLFSVLIKLGEFGLEWIKAIVAHTAA